MLSSNVMARCITATALMATGIFQPAQAEIIPSSSSVLIESGKNQSTIHIKNNGDKSVLLYSKLRKLPDDDLAGGTLFTEPSGYHCGPGRDPEHPRNLSD